MKYLLDTCVISELKKRMPDPKVVAWIDEVEEQKIFLSVLTIGELQKGISKLPDEEKKKTLQEWVDYDLIDRFSGRIVGVDAG